MKGDEYKIVILARIECTNEMNESVQLLGSLYGWSGYKNQKYIYLKMLQ